MSWLAITISHHEIGFSMCSGVIRLCSGLFAWERVEVSPTSAITTIIHCSQMREETGWMWWETDAGEPSNYALSQLENADLAV